MTISCPSCEASYRISPEALGAGRTVRCARCRTEWFAEGARRSVPDDAAEPSLEPEMLEPIESLEDTLAIEAIDSSDPRALADAFQPQIKPKARRVSLLPFRRRAKPEKPVRLAKERRRKASAFKVRPAAAVLALGLIGVGALVGQRVEVVRAAPSLASLYARIGLPVNVRGLSISGVQSVERLEDGAPLLLVTGVVKNVSGDVTEVPRLKLTITADRDRELYAWTTVAARVKLAPGESAPFRARLASPPAEGRGLTVRFVGQSDLARPGR